MRTLIASVGVFLLSCPVLASVPANDSIDGAVPIDALPFVHAEDTRDATTAETDPFCSGQGPTVWYSFVAEEDAVLEVNTFGSNYDTTLSAYIEDPAGIRLVACNDDAAGFQSRLRFNVIEGLTYLFMVAAFDSGPGGDLVLTALTPPDLPEFRLDSEARLRRPGLVTIEGSVSCPRPLDVFVSGNVTQMQKGGRKDGRQPVWAQFPESGFVCEGLTHWTARPIPLAGLFERGPAAVLTTLVVCDEAACDSYFLTTQLKIVKGRKADRYTADEQGRNPNARVLPRKKQ